MHSRAINVWKWAFFILAGALLLSIILLFFWFTSPSVDNGETGSEDNSAGGEFQEYFTVQATTDQLNQLLQEEAGSEQVNIQFAGETAEVTAGIDFLGRSIEAVMTFETEAVENGDLLLTLQQVSVGAFNLPNQQAMTLLASQADLPEAADIDAENQQIRIRMNQITIGDDYSLRVEQFQPENNNIVFNVGK
ncbi:YpmS family protein [Salibacterium lacus]|uniref:YpmS family protein n=1 Tax=Salibacterium lacus TaxID=1898109 RepID=A0ABW5SWY6_9BACI